LHRGGLGSIPAGRWRDSAGKRHRWSAVLPDGAGGHAL